MRCVPIGLGVSPQLGGCGWWWFCLEMGGASPVCVYPDLVCWFPIWGFPQIGCYVSSWGWPQLTCWVVGLVWCVSVEGGVAGGVLGGTREMVVFPIWMVGGGVCVWRENLLPIH